MQSQKIRLHGSTTSVSRIVENDDHLVGLIGRHIIDIKKKYSSFFGRHTIEILKKYSSI